MCSVSLIHILLFEKKIWILVYVLHGLFTKELNSMYTLNSQYVLTLLHVYQMKHLNWICFARRHARTQAGIWYMYFFEAFWKLQKCWNSEATTMPKVLHRKVLLSMETEWEWVNQVLSYCRFHRLRCCHHLKNFKCELWIAMRNDKKWFFQKESVNMNGGSTLSITSCEWIASFFFGELKLCFHFRVHLFDRILNTGEWRISLKNNFELKVGEREREEKAYHQKHMHRHFGYWTK